MNYRNIFVCTLVSAGFVTATKVPVEVLFRETVLSAYAEELKVVIWGSLLIFLLTRLMKVFEIKMDPGRRKWKRYWVFIFPFLYPGVLAASNFNGGCPIHVRSFLLLAFCFVIKGIFEELLFRGFVIGYLMQGNKRGSVGAPVFICSGLFAVSHLVSLGSENPGAVIQQVIYAFFMGLMFGALFLYTCNIWLLGWVHGLFNLLFSICHEGGGKAGMPAREDSLGGFMLHLLMTVIIISPTLFFYFFLVKRISREMKNADHGKSYLSG